MNVFYGNILYVLALVNFSVSEDVTNTELEKHKPKPTPTPFQDWDYLVYSQRWPVTACTEWEIRSKNNTCNMPVQPDTWSVHGLWPTKTGKMGPFNCDVAINFDPDALQPILGDLLQHWVNIEANTKNFSFWKHEWKKHGTCASTLPLLNSVFNYFNQGLEFNKQYNLTDILASANIVPSSAGYTVSDIFNAVKNNLSVIPTIQCEVDKQKNSLISEIRLCFNKSLELIDCTGADGFETDDVLTNCDLKKNVMYFVKTPIENTVQIELDREFYFLLKLYNVLKFLIWYTL